MSDNKIPVNHENGDDEEIKANAEESTSEEMSTMEQFFYHQKRALEETRKAIETLMPPGFSEHSTKASQEFAKGFRVLVDAMIDELKTVSEKDDAETVSEEDDDSPSTTGTTKVKVQVD